MWQRPICIDCLPLAIWLSQVYSSWSAHCHVTLTFFAFSMLQKLHIEKQAPGAACPAHCHVKPPCWPVDHICIRSGSMKPRRNAATAKETELHVREWDWPGASTGRWTTYVLEGVNEAQEECCHCQGNRITCKGVRLAWRQETKWWLREGLRLQYALKSLDIVTVKK